MEHADEALAFAFDYVVEAGALAGVVGYERLNGLLDGGIEDKAIKA